MVDPVSYYRDPRVAGEIASFLRGRWAALEGPGKRWLRWLGDRPLTVSSPSDVWRIVSEHRSMQPRSWYGTIEVFRKLRDRRDVEENYEDNVEKATLFIDIDIVDESRLGDAWRCVVEAARVLVEWLEERGVVESVYLLWSGAGMHLRIHEDALQGAEAHPVDAAFALAEYMLESNQAALLDTIRSCGGLVKIENLVAPKRVFTAPLSLHRRLDRVAVALRPSALPSFHPDWSLPENPRHDPEAWRRAKPGEAAELAREALRRIGRLRKRTLMEARATRLGAPTAPPTPQPAPAATPSSGGPREPGRFQVMALLQAARYYLLKGDLERAKSWGLNRAIFYAWAKHYGPSRRPTARLRAQARRLSSGSEVREEETRWVEVGGEKAMVSPRGWFVIGGVEQRPEDFDRQVARRFEEAGISFREAWEAALEYLRRFPRRVLEDPRLFYKEVYEPVRDRFVEKVLRRRRGGGEETQGLDRWLRKRG